MESQLSPLNKCNLQGEVKVFTVHFGQVKTINGEVYCLEVHRNYFNLQAGLF